MRVRQAIVSAAYGDPRRLTLPAALCPTGAAASADTAWTRGGVVWHPAALALAPSLSWALVRTRVDGVGMTAGRADQGLERN